MAKITMPTGEEKVKEKSSSKSNVDKINELVDHQINILHKKVADVQDLTIDQVKMLKELAELMNAMATYEKKFGGAAAASTMSEEELIEALDEYNKRTKKK